MKKLILLTLIFLTILVLTAGVISSETFKQSTSVDFKKTCTNDNDAICSSSADCNITIKYPNSTYLVQTGTMTNNDDGLFNYTIDNTLTTELGEHTWDMFCCDTDCGEAHGTFKITKTGVELSQDKALIYLGVLGILVFLFLVNMGAIAMLPSSNNKDDQNYLISVNHMKYLRAVLFVFGYGLILAILFTSSNISYLYLETTMMGNLLFAFYQIMGWLTIPMVFLWFIWIFVKIMQDKELKELIERGVPVEGKP